MAVTAFFYGQVFVSAFNKEIDLTADTIKAMILTSTYTPSQDTHRYKSDLTNEVTGTGYTAGGQTLTAVTATYTAGTNVFAFDAADPVWPSSTITGRYVVYYDDTPATDATKPLIGYVDAGADVVSTNGDWAVTIDAAGIASVTVA